MDEILLSVFTSKDIGKHIEIATEQFGDTFFQVIDKILVPSKKTIRRSLCLLVTNMTILV